jgi:hypothetical protein
LITLLYILWTYYSGFQIFLDTKSDTVDMCDENECNWMMFIKPARCEKTQNLIAHQLGHHIYFFTTKEVFCGQELLYWFSKEYATLSGIYYHFILQTVLKF